MLYGKIKINSPENFIKPKDGLKICDTIHFYGQTHCPFTTVKRKKHIFSEELDMMVKNLKDDFEIGVVENIRRMFGYEKEGVDWIGEKFATCFYVEEPVVLSADWNGSNSFPAVGFTIAVEMQIVVSDVPFEGVQYTPEMQFFNNGIIMGEGILDTEEKNKVLSELIETAQGRSKIASALCMPLRFSWENVPLKDAVSEIKKDQCKENERIKDINETFEKCLEKNRNHTSELDIEDFKEKIDAKLKQIKKEEDEVLWALNVAKNLSRVLAEENISWINEDTIQVKLDAETRVHIENICGPYVPSFPSISAGELIGGMLVANAVNIAAKNYLKKDTHIKRVSE
jgi:hypothetical protein